MIALGSQIERANLPALTMILLTWFDHLWESFLTMYKEVQYKKERQRANTRNVSFRISLRWPIHIINPVDKTKLSCNTPTDAAPQFL